MAGSQQQFSRETLPYWVARLEALNVVSRRLNSPDLVQQLKRSVLTPLDTVICVGLDTDPRVPLQQRVAVESAAEIAFACRALARLLGDALAIVAIDSGVAGTFARLAGKRDRRLRVVALENLYPLSHPTLLVKVLRRRRLRPVRPLHEAGVLMIDAVTAVQVASAFTRNEASHFVPIMVCDHAAGTTKLFRMPTHTTVAEALRQAAIGDARVDVYDGPVLRHLRVDHAARVSATELVLNVVRHAAPVSPEPCTRCGNCVSVCPVRLQPASLLHAAQEYNAAAADHFALDACLSCGLCDAVCPSALPIVSSIENFRRALAAPAERTAR